MSGQGNFGERLFDAVEAGDVEAARSALSSGADARYVRVESGDSFRDETPVLFVACAKKSRALVELLLAHGADPNACRTKDDSWHERDTCLRAAMPSVEVVTLLLEKGADPNRPSESGESARTSTHALQDAAGDAELTSLLKRHGADRRKTSA